MPVYMIRCGEYGPVKIGHSVDVPGRLAELQVAHFERLAVVRQWRGGPNEEAVLHGRFEDLRIRGEWFAFSRAMLGDVGLQEILPEPAQIDPVLAPEGEAPIPIKLVVELAGGPLRLGRTLGISHAAVCEWKRVPWSRVLEVAKLTGIPVERLLVPPAASAQDAA